MSGRTVGNHTYNLNVPYPPMAGEMADHIKDHLSNLLHSLQSLFSAAVDVIAHSNPNVDGDAKRTEGQLFTALGSRVIECKRDVAQETIDAGMGSTHLV